MCCGGVACVCGHEGELRIKQIKHVFGYLVETSTEIYVTTYTVKCATSDTDESECVESRWSELFRS